MVNKYKRVALLMIIGFVLLGCSGTSKTTEVKQPAQVEVDDIIDKEDPTQEETVPDEIIEEGQAEEIPIWMNTKYNITSYDAEADYDVGQVSLWSTNPYVDENRTLVTRLNDGQEVTLIDYDESSDYCKIDDGTNVGWLACPWLEGIDPEMADSW